MSTYVYSQLVSVFEACQKNSGVTFAQLPTKRIEKCYNKKEEPINIKLEYGEFEAVCKGKHETTTMEDGKIKKHVEACPAHKYVSHLNLQQLKVNRLIEKHNHPVEEKIDTERRNVIQNILEKVLVEALKGDEEQFSSIIEKLQKLCDESNDDSSIDSVHLSTHNNAIDCVEALVEEENKNIHSTDDPFEEDATAQSMEKTAHQKKMPRRGRLRFDDKQR